MNEISIADFDDTPLAEIEQLMPADEFRAFVEDYLASTVERLERALALEVAGDLAALRAEAHVLISTAGSYGLRRASILARQVETACKAGRAEDAAGLLAQLAVSSQRGSSALRARFLA